MINAWVDGACATYREDIALLMQGLARFKHFYPRSLE
jgi:hypothetical protein